ncbi:ATP-binding protein, partial [Streptomyces sp. NPDC054838]
DDTGGRGLELVDGLADRWGWQREGAGKRIWCEIDRAKKACADRAEDTPERSAEFFAPIGEPRVYL